MLLKIFAPQPLFVHIASTQGKVKMESLQKFDLCEELSDKELATISAGSTAEYSAFGLGSIKAVTGTGQVGVTGSGTPGTASTEFSSEGVSYQGSGLAGNTTVQS